MPSDRRWIFPSWHIEKWLNIEIYIQINRQVEHRKKCALDSFCLPLGKPSRPQGPLFPDEIRADHVKLKWKKPEDDGGMPIDGYIIEKMDLDTGAWVPAGEVRFSFFAWIALHNSMFDLGVKICLGLVWWETYTIRYSVMLWNEWCLVQFCFNYVVL